MSKLNTNSNGYTIGFMVVMVVIVGGMLAMFSEFTKETIAKNVEFDLKSKILKSVSYQGKDILEEYSKNIKAIAINSDGELIEGLDGYSLNLKKEYKLEAKERRYPIFIYSKNDKKSYIVPLIGLGLWDEINGFVAFKEDLTTLQGVAYDHVGETPGLGGEITKSYFQDRFVDKQVFDKDGNYVLHIYKSGKSPNGISDIDGLSGATLTTEGMDNMHRHCIPNYLNYFKKLKK